MSAVEEEEQQTMAAGGVKRLSLDSLMAKLQQDPHYLPTPDDVRHLVEDEFPEEDPAPNAENVDDALKRYNHRQGLPYATGQWVERFGDDMEWHLEPIRRTMRKKSENSDEWIYYYKMGSGIVVKAEDVRVPQEALARMFGMRPFLWQQCAFYKIERFVRFQANHERDFEFVDYVESARLLFEDWLHDEKNKDFLELYESKDINIQQKLRTHLLTPFKLMNTIVRQEEGWDLSESYVSVYQYNSFLGSGWFMSALVIFIQLIVPLLLLIFQVRSSVRFPAYNHGDATSWQIIGLFATDWDTFCYQRIPFDALMMNIVVFIVYSIRVVPIVFTSFYETVGDAPTMSSRLNSLRSIIWHQGDDTIWQQMGFKLERYMNSVYIALVNALMLIILFLTDNTVDVILNALAIDFLYNFDRDVPAFDWYDPDYRFLRASIVEMLFRGGVLLELVENPDFLCETYDIDREEYDEKVGGPLWDAKLAAKDNEDPRYMHAKDKIWIASVKVAKELHRSEALWQFQESVATFGVGDYLMHKFFHTSGGIFNRFTNAYTWSRWEKVLFLPRVPGVGRPAMFANLASVRLEKIKQKKAQLIPFGRSSKSNGGKVESRFLEDDDEDGNVSSIRLMNFDPASSWDPLPRFLWSLSKTMTFQNLLKDIKVVLRRKKPHHVPFRLVDGIFEWMSYLFLLVVFPLWIGFYAFLVIECQPIDQVGDPPSV